MDKTLEKCKRDIIVALAIRSLLCFIVKSDFSAGIIQIIFRNEVLVDICNEWFLLVCFLAVFRVIWGVAGSINRKYTKHMGAPSGMGEFRQGNRFFLFAVFAFVVGIAFIGGGLSLAYNQMGNFAVGFMLAAGIVSEIAAIYFGFLQQKAIKQMTAVHRLTSMREQFDLLMQAAAELDLEEKVVAEILRDVLNDRMENR